MYDFQDFYCAGDVIDRGGDPYRYEPLHTCEQRVRRNAALYAAHPALVIPAPQPPYDFVAFMALARLDFEPARMLYAGAIVVAFVLSILALAKTGIPADVAAIALVLPVGYLQLDSGQVIPFAFLFLTACGAALTARRDAIAGIFAAIATIEPHLGLSTAIAVLFFVPRARVALLATGAALAAAGIAAVGPHVAFEYVTRVLPAQAGSEIAFPYQYSLTYALNALGVAPAVAQTAGIASFLVLLAAGLWLAPRLARSLERRELLAFFPAATAVMAGPYLHMVSLCFAIPAALVFATRLTGRLRDVSAAAVCALMVPWIMVWAIKKLFLAVVFLIVVLLLRLQVTPWFAVTLVTSVTALIYAFELRSPDLPATSGALGRFGAGDLAQAEWRAFTDQLRTGNVRWFAIKLPTWSALTALLAVAVARLRRS